MGRSVCAISLMLLLGIAVTDGVLQAATSTPPFSAAKLEHEISSRITKVEEFKFLRQICADLKIRCWLFGGTAAGYAHYVKWDLLRETGDPRYQPDRFDYDYMNIFRSTQDADLVIDGTEGQAKEIEKILREKFQHFQGSKSAWEVRLLRESRGEKEALLHNPDFLNQHTDSNSTGMVEVTQPFRGESAVRDLRDWTPTPQKPPIFLEDIYHGKLHYYFSPSHHTTSRFRLGKNPTIMSVIRYLTKAFQYELEITPEDRAKILKIIKDFRPETDLTDDYVKNWIEKNSKKLIQNAVNIEYAWNQLKELGLRSKLASIGDPSLKDSLAWWMNKEPLRSHPLGRGAGKTAKALGIDIVAHETSDFLAYESITRAHTGDPNVLISRKDAPNETAGHGDGFYTARGRRGARGTGMTIRFEVAKTAREGTDFFLADSGDPKLGSYIIFTNKNALRVIPESIYLDPVQYFRLLATEEGINKDDLGIYEKLKRKLRIEFHNLSQVDWDEIISLVQKEMTKEDRFNPPRLQLVEEFFDVLSGSPNKVSLEAKRNILLKLVTTSSYTEGSGFDLGQGFDEKIAGLLKRRSQGEPWLIEALKKRLQVGSTRAKKEAAYYLATIVNKSDDACQVLIDALTRNQDPEVTLAIIKTLNRHEVKNPKLMDTLLEVFGSEAFSEPHRIAAAETLARLFNEQKKVHDALFRGLQSSSISMQAAAASAFRFHLRSNDPKVSSALIDLLDRADLSDVNSNLLGALVNQRISDPAIIEQYIIRLDRFFDERYGPANRTYFVNQLLQSIPNDQHELAARLLTQALAKSEVPPARRQMIYGLASLKVNNPDKIVSILIDRLSSDSNPEVRSAAAQGLRNMGKRDDWIIESLKKGSVDASSEVRADSIEALIQLDKDDQRLVQLLLDALQDKDEKVVQKAIFGLSLQNLSGKEAMKKILSASERTPYIHLMREDFSQALARFKPDDVDAIDALIEGLRTHSSIQTVGKGAVALSRLKPTDKKAAQTIVQAFARYLMSWNSEQSGSYLREALYNIKKPLLDNSVEWKLLNQVLTSPHRSRDQVAATQGLLNLYEGKIPSPNLGCANQVIQEIL